MKIVYPYTFTITAPNIIDFGGGSNCLYAATGQAFSTSNLFAVIDNTDQQMVYILGNTPFPTVSTSVALPAAGQCLLTFTNPSLTINMAQSDSVTVLYDFTGQQQSIASTSVTFANDAAGVDTAFNKIIVGNTRDKFRDEFINLDTTKWVFSASNINDVVSVDGNTAGAGFLKISKSPIVNSTETIITSVNSYLLPVRLGFAPTLSQRITGQEFYIELVSCDASGNILTDGFTDVPQAISTITIATTNATITYTSAHNYVPGDRIAIYGAPDSRANGGAYTVTTINSLTQIIASTATTPAQAVTYTSVTGAYSVRVHPTNYATNAATLLYDSTTAANAIYMTRGFGTPYIASASTSFGTNFSVAVANLAYVQPFTYNYGPGFNVETFINMDHVTFVSQAIDSTSGLTNVYKRTQSLPDPAKYYKIRIRAKNLANFSSVVARIVSATKSASAVATFTTDVAHGLTVNDYVQLYGTIDTTGLQTNFLNIATATVIAAPSGTTFTLSSGTVASLTGYGGVVVRVQGGNTTGSTSTGLLANCVVSVTGTAATGNAPGYITLVGTVTFGGLVVVGQTIYLYGLYRNSSPFTALPTYEGMYKVAFISTTTVFLIPMNGLTVTTFSTITCGGAIFLVTDFRLHFCRMLDFTRHAVEVVGGLTRNDQYLSIPCNVTNTPAATISSGTVTTVSTLTYITSASPVTTVAYTSAAGGGVADFLGNSVWPLYNSVATAALSLGTTATSSRSKVNITCVADKPGYVIYDAAPDLITYHEAARFQLTSNVTPVGYLATIVARATTGITTLTVTGHNLIAGQCVVIGGCFPVDINTNYATVSSVTATTVVVNTPSGPSGAATPTAATAANTAPAASIASGQRTANVVTFRMKNVITLSNIALVITAGVGVLTLTTSAVHGFTTADYAITLNVLTGVTSLNLFSGTIITASGTTLTMNYYGTLTAFNTACTGGFYVGHPLVVGSTFTSAGWTPGSLNFTGCVLSVNSGATAGVGTFTSYNINSVDTSAATVVGTITFNNPYVAPALTQYSTAVTVPGVNQTGRARYVDTYNGYRADLTQISKTNQLVTATTNAAHSFIVGDVITIAGCVTAGYNGTWVIVGVPSTTVFCFYNTANATDVTVIAPATGVYGACGYAVTSTSRVTIFINSTCA